VACSPTTGLLALRICDGEGCHGELGGDDQDRVIAAFLPSPDPDADTQRASVRGAEVGPRRIVTVKMWSPK
jgi:hypothetical protein